MKVLSTTSLTELITKIKTWSRSTFLNSTDVEQTTEISIDTTPTTSSANLVTSGGVKTALDAKANTVASATNGNFAGLNASGNLTDSGYDATDFIQTSDAVPSITLPNDADTLQGHSASYFAAQPNKVTTGTEITLVDNTEYVLTDVTSLTITYPAGDFACWLRITTAASGTVTITLPTSSYVGSAPTFGNAETWMIYIENGIVVSGKAVSA